MRNSIYLWFIALIIWILGAWWILNGCCFLGAGLNISDGTAFGASHKSNLMYALSSPAAILPNNGVKGEFSKLAGYLKENPDRGLTLTGQYDSDTEKAGLGKARAESLKTKLIELGAPAGAITTAGMVNSKLGWDKDEKNAYGAMKYEFSKLVTGISISDGAKFSAANGANLNFNKSSYAFNTPLTADIKDVFQKTANYLKANPARNLMLTGYAMKSENNTSALGSLGLARANSVKNLLTSMGAPANQVDITSQINDGLKVTGNNIVGGVTYAFEAKNNDKLAAVTSRLAKPLILYFKTGSDELSLDQNQRNYLGDLIYYLDNKVGGKAVSTGHTDNVGSTSANVRLSRKRAEFVKDYLVRNGINGSKISAEGKGPNQPIAPNSTDEGKAKNRRVEITIQ